MAELTGKAICSLKEPGMYADGVGLHLRVGPDGSKLWILRTMVHGGRPLEADERCEEEIISEERARFEALLRVA